MKKKELQVARPRFPDKEPLLERISSILESGRLMNGEFTKAFETGFAEYLKVPYSVSVNSCTTALEIVLKHIGVEAGEVIVPTNTFIATPNAVLFAGGTPILADIKKETYFLDPDEVRRLISKKTKAVIAVYIGGLVPPEIEEIALICEEQGIPLIEDCAHAMGASFHGKFAGKFGYAGCFSFYPTKIITTGSGGMITTRDEGLAAFAKSMRLHGAGDGLTDVINVGNDWFMDEIKSALGLNQMEHLVEFLARRRAVAARYDEWLASTELIWKLPVHTFCEHAYYKYPVQVADEIDVQGMKEIFREKYGFELESIYWPTCHLQPVYKKLFGYSAGRFPVAERTLSKQITLPLHAGISFEDAEYAFSCVISEIRSRQCQK